MTEETCCPQCESNKLYKAGLRHSPSGTVVQRWLCRGCGYRFSDPNHKRNLDFSYGGKVQNTAPPRLKESSDFSYQCQVGASRQGKAKNLASVEIPTKGGPAGATPANTATIKGKTIDFLWWAEKQGYAKQTIRSFGSCLRALLYREDDLLNPESVKEALAREKKWSQNRRRNVINTYTTFLRFNGMKWEKPKCRVEKKIPFIPMEKELDALIAGSNRKLAAFLQVLKETAMRSGEAKSLLWSNIDFERHLIILNAPEKGSNPPNLQNQSRTGRHA